MYLHGLFQSDYTFLLWGWVLEDWQSEKLAWRYHTTTLFEHCLSRHPEHCLSGDFSIIYHLPFAICASHLQHLCHLYHLSMSYCIIKYVNLCRFHVN